MRPILIPFVLAAALPAAAATIDVRVTDARGVPIRDAVVYAVPEGRTAPAPPRRTAVMDQKNRMFIPHVLPIQTGTSVRFPNSDDIRHHVYSFSPAKPFQLPLYKGTPANPILFDRAGVVTLGCNIHDQMTAYIVIVDTPWFEKTGATGSATLKDLDAGRYAVRVWYPEMRDEPAPETVTVAGGDRIAVSFGSGHGRP
ncbi:MAG TPA: methylamine utilization protein [Thermoanaerobaculia bacterium]|nr:methylamine utilization protein [Thermoanaerobaculia bacterium]